MAIISDVLRGPYGDIQPNVIITMQAKGTTARVLTSNRSSTVTDAAGKYSMTVFPGEYEVTVSTLGHVGDIRVLTDSVDGTLNDFLISPPKPDELTPEVVRTVDTMRAESAASAAAAKTSETNASAAMTNALSKVVATEQTVAGSVKFNNGVTSLSDVVMQAKTPGANVIMRFKDVDGVEKGAIFNTVSTGQMTQRWGGTTFSAIYGVDGSVTFPSDIYSGSAKVATRATGLGTKHLNTVIDEGDYYQHSSANATVANGYPPIALAGVLKVLKSRAASNGREGVTQIYFPWNDQQYFLIRVYKGTTDTWSDWENYRSQIYNDTRYASAQGIGKTFADLDAFKTWQSSQNGLTSFRLSAAVGGFPAYNPGLIWNTSDTYAMLMPYYSSSEIKCVTGNASGKYQEFFLWNTGNTTVDSNGFIKKASPIVKLFGNGESELNEQSQGVTTERIDTGVYRVFGVLGFNGDGAWGGAGNGIEIPVDENKRALVWVESKVLPDGDIEIRTYHRTYDTGPYSARNIEAMDSGEVDKKKQPIFVEMPDGTPIDIPAGRWIDLRVEMPASDEPEYEPVPEDEVPEVIPDVTEPEGGEEPAPGEVPALIEEPKE
ncbi:prophage tail fiber N-terminal domain-containing protein [Serratia fonticola]|uniref:phage tail fiber protein n=1 Tax=Serratia fonticola TaxID=47917 RepID=UPI001AE8FF31|nr:prophage tail fiber N-terminal domain-containing protein [Serratia fonticola]MBP1034819.1 prophage tail fiber N-terminal domain-containing protein [Serratia fonticola]